MIDVRCLGAMGSERGVRESTVWVERGRAKVRDDGDRVELGWDGMGWMTACSWVGICSSVAVARRGSLVRRCIYVLGMYSTYGGMGGEMF